MRPMGRGAQGNTASNFIYDDYEQFLSKGYRRKIQIRKY